MQQLHQSMAAIRHVHKHHPAADNLESETGYLPANHCQRDHIAMSRCISLPGRRPAPRSFLYHVKFTYQVCTDIANAQLNMACKPGWTAKISLNKQRTTTRRTNAGYYGFLSSSSTSPEPGMSADVSAQPVPCRGCLSLTSRHWQRHSSGLDM